MTLSTSTTESLQLVRRLGLLTIRSRPVLAVVGLLRLDWQEVAVGLGEAVAALSLVGQVSDRFGRCLLLEADSRL